MNCEHTKQAWKQVDTDGVIKLHRYCVQCQQLLEIRSTEHFQKWVEGLI